MRTIVYSAYPSIRFPEVLGDYLQDKSDDLDSPSNRLHQPIPIEMKTMPLPVSPQINFLDKADQVWWQRTPLSSDSTTPFLSEIIVEEPDGLSDNEGSVVVNTGRDASILGATISSRASLPKPVTTPRRRFVNTFLGRR